MTADIAAILAIDGIATGAVYALVAIGTVLIFTVTRVIFIPFGDIAAFTALTLAQQLAFDRARKSRFGVDVQCVPFRFPLAPLGYGSRRFIYNVG